MNNQFLLKKKTQPSDQSQGGEFLSEPVQTLERGLKPFFFSGCRKFQLSLLCVSLQHQPLVCTVAGARARRCQLLQKLALVLFLV